MMSILEDLKFKVDVNTNIRVLKLHDTLFTILGSLRVTAETG